MYIIGYQHNKYILTNIEQGYIRNKYINLHK